MKTKKSSLDSTIETVEWKLPELRVESPSTTVWGRLSQAMRHACGMILIRRPKTSLLQIAAQYLSEVRNSFLISSDSSIPLKDRDDTPSAIRQRRAGLYIRISPRTATIPIRAADVATQWSVRFSNLSSSRSFSLTIPERRLDMSLGS